MTSLQEINEHAQTEATRRGFRSLGIYHLIWAVHKLEPEALDDLLNKYQIEKAPFIKMLENTLRPRRAGGGVPRDKQDAALCAAALKNAAKLNDHPTTEHLLLVLPRLQEDPITSLCNRFALSCTPPKTQTA